VSTHGQTFNYSSGVPGELSLAEPAFAGRTSGRNQIVSSLTFGRIVTGLEVCADFATSAFATFAAYYIYYEMGIGKHLHFPPKELSLFASIVGLIVIFLYERDSAYRSGTSLLRIRETERALKVPCISLVLLLPLNWLSGQAMSRGMVLILLFILPLLLMIQKSVFHTWVGILHSKGYGIRNVMIYGAGHVGRRLFTALLNSKKVGYKPVAISDHDPSFQGSHIFELGYNRRESVCVNGGAVTAEYLRRMKCQVIFIAIHDLRQELLSGLVQAATQAKCQIAFLPNRHHVTAFADRSIDLDGLLLTLAAEPSLAWPYTILKRALDLVTASLLLAVLSPLLLLIAIVVRLDSEGRAIFKQERVGLNGKRFQIFKFRTMNVNAPKYSTSPVFSNDARITRIGKLLRKTSLDELPQLINVLIGDMSLVGPRPEMPFIVDQYNQMQRQRLKVTPGITGLWQLSADRAFLIHESPEYDLYYIRNRGLFLDLAILVHTFLFAMRGV
jgi:exopolysaccharide biosynthesis polyprenyl glycosylphosphotransferase